MWDDKSLQVLEVAKRRSQKRHFKLLWVSVYLGRRTVLLARASLSRAAPQHQVPLLKSMVWLQGRPQRTLRYRISLETLSFLAHQVLFRKSSPNVELSWKSASSRNRPIPPHVSTSNLKALLPHSPPCQTSISSRLTETSSKFRSSTAL